MDLNLAEELLLLGLDAESGEILLSVSTALPYGLAGAIILELHLSGRIEIVDNKIRITNSTPTNNEIFDEVIELIKSNPKEETPKFWIRNINGSIDDLVERLIAGLVQKGVLKKEAKKILWIIPVDRFPAKDVLPEVHTRILIRSLVLENLEANERNVALLSLVKSTNLIDELFLKDERKQATNIINEIIANDSVGKAISDINAEVTSIIASSVAGTVAAASVVGNF